MSPALSVCARTELYAAVRGGSHPGRDYSPHDLAPPSLSLPLLPPSPRHPPPPSLCATACSMETGRSHGRDGAPHGRPFLPDPLPRLLLPPCCSCEPWGAPEFPPQRPTRGTPVLVLGEGEVSRADPKHFATSPGQTLVPVTHSGQTPRTEAGRPDLRSRSGDRGQEIPPEVRREPEGLAKVPGDTPRAPEVVGGPPGAREGRGLNGGDDAKEELQRAERSGRCCCGAPAAAEARA